MSVSQRNIAAPNPNDYYEDIFAVLLAKSVAFCL